MKTKKLPIVPLFIAFILLASILPLGIVTAGTPTPEQVNDYSIQVASLVKEKCNGNCKNVVLLGDDYVIPSFRRAIKWLNWYIPFTNWKGNHTDKILTDIGYVQRSEMEFSNLYALITKQLDGLNFEGKNFLLILPDSLSTEQRTAINDLKSEFETKFKSHFSEKKSSEVYCNDPQLWNNMNGYTLMVIGTEKSNQAYNCFPFQAGLENRDAAFIDVNPWDGRNYAVIFNTEDPQIIDVFTLFIHNETFKGIRSETAYFMKIGAKVAVYGAITLAVLSGVGAAAGLAGAGAIATSATVMNYAAGAAVLTDSCYYDSYTYGESWGGCVKDGIIILVLPKVIEKTTKYVISNVLVYFSKFGDDVIRVFKSPATDSVFKDGTRAAGTAVLREGTESWGWKHILFENHNNDIKAAFNLVDNDVAVKNLIGEALENPNLIKNGDELIFEKLVNGETKKLVIVIGEDLDKLGAIITAYPQRILK